MDKIQNDKNNLATLKPVEPIDRNKDEKPKKKEKGGSDNE